MQTQLAALAIRSALLQFAMTHWSEHNPLSKRLCSWVQERCQIKPSFRVLRFQVIHTRLWTLAFRHRSRFLGRGLHDRVFFFRNDLFNINPAALLISVADGRLEVSKGVIFQNYGLHICRLAAFLAQRHLFDPSHGRLLKRVLCIPEELLVVSQGLPLRF